MRCHCCTIFIGQGFYFKKPYFLDVADTSYPFCKDCYEYVKRIPLEEREETLEKILIQTYGLENNPMAFKKILPTLDDRHTKKIREALQGDSEEKGQGDLSMVQEIY